MIDLKLYATDFARRWRLAGKGYAVCPLERLGGMTVIPFYRIPGREVEQLVLGIEQLARENVELSEKVKAMERSRDPE